MLKDSSFPFDHLESAALLPKKKKKRPLGCIRLECQRKKKIISLVWPKSMNSKDKSNQKKVTGSSILNWL